MKSRIVWLHQVIPADYSTTHEAIDPDPAGVYPRCGGQGISDFEITYMLYKVCNDAFHSFGVEGITFIGIIAEV